MFEELRNAAIIPVLTIEDSDQAARLAKVLYENGLTCAEVTFRTPAAKRSIEIMKKTCPDMTILAGTVLNAQQAKDAMKAGACAVVSPGFNPRTVRYCLNKEIPIIPGVATPSEIEEALNYDLRVLKFFPAKLNGGVKMLEALHGPYADVCFMPTGGINPENAEDYLAKDYVWCLGGTWIATKDLINAGDFETIAKLARQACQIAKKYR